MSIYLSEKAIAYINREDRVTKKYTAINGDKALTLCRNYDNSKNGTFLCVDCNGRIDALKSTCLTSRYNKGVETFGSNPFLYNGSVWRKLTPVECERLQGLPDNYTASQSNSQRYKAIGNGWQVDTITHILKNSGVSGNFLSLFDGISCGRVALDKLGVKVDNYFASEVDKYAIKVSKLNYPDIVHIGDVTGVKINNLPFVPDALIGGSPCQGFSFAGKQLNFEDPRSKLFFEYVRILKELKEINPECLFLLENVRMSKKSEAVITNYLGVEPVMIDSSLVSAQIRKRLYWANFPISQPNDKGINLSDILQTEKEINN